VEGYLKWLEGSIERLEELHKKKKHRRIRDRLAPLSPRYLLPFLSQLGLFRPEADLDPFGFDPSLYERIRPVVRFLFEEYFRVEVEGVEQVPVRGPAILVANHGGLFPLDALLIRYALEEYHPTGHSPRFLIEDWFMQLPFVGIFLARLGALRGSPTNARYLLKQGEIVGIFPEGAKAVGKPFRHRYEIQRFGRGGVIRLAVNLKVPIIPAAVVGAEETHPVLLRIPLPTNRSGIQFFPLTPFFPWLGLLGLIPLPVRWVLRFHPPFPLPDRTPLDEPEIARLNDQLRKLIQSSVFELYQRRRTAWIL
jgi:1-acyl-sn-glycerol-3-phosphate acyltransferase